LNLLKSTSASIVQGVRLLVSKGTVPHANQRIAHQPRVLSIRLPDVAHLLVAHLLVAHLLIVGPVP